MTKPDEKAASGARCIRVLTTEQPDEIAWEFDDGSTVVTEFDLSTAAGQNLVAAQAEKLGFGRRADIRRLLSAPIGPGPGVILGPHPSEGVG